PGAGWGVPASALPPSRGRGPLVAIIAGVAAVLVLAVVAVVAVVGVSSYESNAASPPGPAGSSTAGDVHFTIVNNLSNIQIASTATIYSLGKQVGVIQVDRSSPSSRIQVAAAPPEADYQLSLTMILADAEQHKITLQGA